jgi:hypothetical protein
VTVIIVATTCVGRDPELAELGRRYAHTATGGTDVVAVLGEPGIGKSALLLRLANEHGVPGGPTFRKAASEHGSGFSAPSPTDRSAPPHS